MHLNTEYQQANLTGNIAYLTGNTSNLTGTAEQCNDFDNKHKY